MQQLIQLSQLAIDDAANIRKTGRGSEPTYVATIRSKGIIIPFLVRKNGDGFKVHDGGKRLESLRWMAEHGDTANGVVVTDTYPVPCIVEESTDAEARETSLIVSICRTPPHPVDQYETFAELTRPPSSMKPADIAVRFGISEQQVSQALALGQKLSPALRAAWRENQIDAEDAKAFTLAPDHKAQDAIYAKLSKQQHGFDADDIRSALKVDGDVGKLLLFVGIDEYEKRKGKVNRDLFGSNHTVSDVKLLRAMTSEKLEAICEKLVKEDGWAWAFTAKDLHSNWDYGRIEPKSRATTEERQRLNALQAVAEDESDEDAAEKADAEHTALEAAIHARAFTADMKAKSGCIVSFGYHGLEIGYGRVKPEEKRKVEAQQRAATKKKANGGKAAEPKISAALEARLSVTLTTAACKAIVGDPDLALTFAIAGLHSFAGVVALKNDGRGAHENDQLTEFDEAFKLIAKRPAKERMVMLARQVGAAFILDCRAFTDDDVGNMDSSALVANTIDGKAMNKALRESFDATDYFSGVSKEFCRRAVLDAMGKDHAGKVANMKTKEAAEFATMHVPKTGWLPPELRTAHYDGPKVKAASTAKPKKAAKKTAKRKR